MNERLHGPEAFNPSGWLYTNSMVDRLTESGLLPKLSEEEVASLLAGDPLQDPAPMQTFASIEGFKEGQNNFWAAFQSKPGGSIWLLQRRRPAFQRFVLLYPEKVAELSQEHEMFTEFDESTWTSLYEAYQLMSQLVSMRDPVVVGEDGVYKEYLCD